MRWLQLSFTLTLLLWCASSFAQEQYQFTHYRAKNGLSSDHVKCVIKDKIGYIWIGTDKGLSRFNGLEFKNYYNKPFDSLSLPSNVVNCLYTDPSGSLWIGTTNGLCVYNPYTDAFDKADFLNHETVYAIWENGGSGMLISTNRGLLAYELKSGRLSVLLHLSEVVYAVHKRRSGNMLVLMPKGLFEYSPASGMVSEIIAKGRNGLKEILRMHVLNDSIVFLGMHELGCRAFNINQKRFERLPLRKNDASRLGSDMVHVLAPDSIGNLWIGTTRGLKIYDLVDFKYTELKSNLSEPNGLNSNNISAIYHDRDGIVWVGTEDAGVNVYDRKAIKFKASFPHINKNPDKDIRFTKSFLKDRNGEIWIGTDYGLFRFDKTRRLIGVYEHDSMDANTIGAGGVTSLYEDSRGRFWVGTWGGGLGLFDRRSGRVKRYEYHDDRFDPEYIGDVNVLSIAEDENGWLWLGMINYILDAYDPTKNKFQHFAIGDFNWKVISDNVHSRTWFCSDSGLCMIDRKTLKIKRYLHDPKDSASISDNSVNSIAMDKAGNIWAATNDGLNCFLPDEGIFLKYKIDIGFASNYLLGVVLDDLGHIWISHDKGISRFEPESKRVVNFDEHDGAKVNCSFSYKAPDGELFFGGADGMINFYPSEILLNSDQPSIVVSEATIFNRPIETYDDVQVSGSLDRFSEVRIPYRYSSITFKFSALNFTAPQKCRFAYRFNNDSTLYDLGNRREITLANLEPGEYGLSIIASNNDGVWNKEGLQFTLVIQPPFYLTTLFKVLMTMVVLAGIFIVSTLRWRQAKAQRKKLEELVRVRTVELEIQKQEIIEKNIQIKQISERLHFIDQQRINFLVNVSHEFRTPLILIISPLERLFNTIKSSDGTSKVVESVLRNSQRLLRLVNQVLDIQKVETGNMKLSVTQSDIVLFLRNIHFSFLTLAEKKGIDFHFDAHNRGVRVYFDEDKIEKVLFNLLSNAFKFTPSGGMVTLSVSGILNIDSTEIGHEFKAELLRNGFIGDAYIQIQVADTGVGLSAEQRERIFDRFYQAEPVNFEGMGIGLNLAKDMIQLHHGLIWVKENFPKGTMFCFIIPALANQYRKDEMTIRTHISSADVVELNDPALEIFCDPPEVEEDLPNVRNLPVLLLVDDNQEFRVFLRQNLDHTFHVVVAGNGTVGFRKAVQLMPDIIVSDVMMSGMDGIEFCKRIKSDERTGHIPVILLTAKIGAGNYMMGLDMGADDYIAKPFNLEALKARINSLIKSRQNLRRVFSKSPHIGLNTMDFRSSDERFLHRAVSVVEKYLSDVEFDAEVFSQEIGMGKTNLYLKLKSLTGGSVNDFIKSVRLNKAAAMLKERRFTVTEVAINTGFSSQSYFTRCFKAFFGKSPSEFPGGEDSDRG